MTSDHDQFDELVAAYALDACAERERRLVAAHLVGCQTCERVFHRLSTAVAALPLAAEPVRPPDRLRVAVLVAAARAQRPSRPRPGPPLAARSPERDRSRHGRRQLPMQWAAVATLGVALLGLGLRDIVLDRALTAAPQSYAIVSTGSMMGVSGRVTYDRQREVVTAALTDVPQPPAGDVYEVWLIDASGRTTPAGVFRPGADGTARVAVVAPPADARTVAVTQEVGPIGTSAPTRKPEVISTIR